MRKREFVHGCKRVVTLLIFGLIAIEGVQASPVMRSPPLGVVWYSDGAFVGMVVPKPIATQQGWKEVINRPWPDKKFSQFNMTNHWFVSSCNQLFAANRDGLKVESDGMEWKRFDVISITCYAARAILDAVPARTSYLSEFRMDGRGARSLPAALTLVISNSRGADIRQAKKQGETLGDVVAKSATFKRIANPRGAAPMVRVNDGTGGIEDISLLARGDFNHDGIEDLLISVSSSVVGGTYTQNDLYLVTRLAPNAPMKVLKAYPDLGLGIPTFR